MKLDSEIVNQQVRDALARSNVSSESIEAALKAKAARQEAAQHEAERVEQKRRLEEQGRQEAARIAREEKEARARADLAMLPKLTRTQWEGRALSAVRGRYKKCKGFLVAKYEGKDAHGREYVSYLLLKEPVSFSAKSEKVEETERWNGLLWRGTVSTRAAIYGTYGYRDIGDGYKYGFDWEKALSGTDRYVGTDQQGLERILGFQGPEVTGGVTLDAFFGGHMLVATDSWECTEVTELPRFPSGAK